jgi:hypothetical protein
MIIQENHYNSLYFQGGSWIEFPKIENMKMAPSANDFTLQFWISGGAFNINDAPAFFSIVDSDNKIKLASGRDLGNNNAITTITNDNVPLYNEMSEVAWENPDNFYLISFLFSASNTKDLTIYINKNKLGLTESSGAIDVGNASLIFGAIANKEYTILENFWYGYIDEIRLWNTWLADTTIQFQTDHPNKFGEYYRYTEDGEEIDTYLDSLIGLWRFNLSELTTTAKDESTHGHDGTIYTYPNTNYFLELSEKGAQ